MIDLLLENGNVITPLRIIPGGELGGRPDDKTTTILCANYFRGDFGIFPHYINLPTSIFMIAAMNAMQSNEPWLDISPKNCKTLMEKYAKGQILGEQIFPKPSAIGSPLSQLES